MNPLDILMLLLVGYFFLMGFFRGVVRELFSIAGVIGGFFAGSFLYPYVSSYLQRWILNESYRSMLSFILLLTAVMVIMSIAGIVVKYLLKMSLLTWTDRGVAAGLAIMKGILTIGVLLFVFISFLHTNPSVIRSSVLAPRLAWGCKLMSKVSAHAVQQEFDVKLEELRKTWKH